MILWLLASAALIWLACAAGWLWLSAGLRGEGLRGRAGRIAVQLSGFALLAGVLGGSPLVALAGAAFPPTALLLLDRILRAPELASALLPWALGGALAGGLLSGLFLWWRGARTTWALGLSLLAGTLAMTVSGEVISRRAMCSAAADHGATTVLRNSFSWSLRHPRRAFNFEVHGLTRHDEVTRIWSYRSVSWHALPETIARNIDVPPHRLPCP
ncbi:hypothetical protein [Vannielia litorea]|uniref:Uncharacterized protein n=1 Tax=Vannielia litorea TaxID=1217970 RepID=A0A1N6E743_9RHOB|nr:hypothetical protein [Vannielia litorea]SIN78813.1 hypothetical protein SAMN05444002_0408 [Vannielia litorea]